MVGALFSHPLDVVKTCMQGDMERKRYGSALETFRSLVREGGTGRLFNGAFWRTFNITATVYVANECSLRLPPYITAITRS